MKIFYYLLIAVIFAAVGWFANTLYHLPKSPTNIVSQVNPKPLERYSVENLAASDIKPGKIEIGEVLKDEKDFSSSKFLMQFSPDLSGNLKKVSGLINVPKKEGPFPIVVLLRGYVDQKEYKTGDGTRRAGEYFAQNGLMTIAPDFLGYADSDREAENIFESRFQTYTTTLTLLKSLATIPQFDQKNVFLWGHSNGGQIALTILEITGANYPSVLWAPVSKPFPYSILYYTDESDDRGKLIRRELAKFEEDYDVEKYSLSNYLDRIKAPIQLHQGTSDEALPVAWSNAISKSLLDLNLDLDYLKYPGADHNLQPAWNTAINLSLRFYRKFL